MFGWIAAIVFVLIVAQLAAFHIQRRDHAFEKAAVAVQALATTVAIMFAGYWYIYERKGQPQANTALEVVGLKVSKDTVLLESRFAVSNLGATLLEIGDTDVRLQKMNADRPGLEEIQQGGWQDFPATVAGWDAYDDGVLLWPTVKWFKGHSKRRVEPGETDRKIVDFLTSCGNTAMSIYFAIQRPGSNQVWSDRAILGLAELCAKPIGSKEILSDRKTD